MTELENKQAKRIESLEKSNARLMKKLEIKTPRADSGPALYMMASNYDCLKKKSNKVYLSTLNDLRWLIEQLEYYKENNETMEFRSYILKCLDADHQKINKKFA